MVEILELVLLVALGLLAIPFVLGPPVIRFTQRMHARPTFYRAPSDTEFPLEVRTFFNRVAAELSPEGFTVDSYAVQEAQVAQVRTTLALFRQPDGPHTAAAITMHAPVGTQVVLQTAYVEFSTRLEDGTIVDTSNTQVLPSFKPVPSRIIHQLPGLQHTADLFRIHQQVVRREAHRGAPVPFPPDGVRVMEDAMARELSEQVATGYLRLDGSHYTPTWKGAFLMTWGLCWPVSALRRSVRNARNRSLLQPSPPGAH